MTRFGIGVNKLLDAEPIKIYNINNPRTIHDVPLEEFDAKMDRGRSIALGFVPLMLTRLALREVEALLNMLSRNCVKGLMSLSRYLTKAVEQYDAFMLKHLGKDSVQLFECSFEDYLPYVAHVDEQAKYAVRHVSQKTLPDEVVKDLQVLGKHRGRVVREIAEHLMMINIFLRESDAFETKTDDEIRREVGCWARHKTAPQLLKIRKAAKMAAETLKIELPVTPEIQTLVNVYVNQALIFIRKAMRGEIKVRNKYATA